MRVQDSELSEEMNPSRSGRVFQRGAGWYFRTREGHDHGPYKSNDEVVENLAFYMDLKLNVVNERNKNAS